MSAGLYQRRQGAVSDPSSEIEPVEDANGFKQDPQAKLGSKGATAVRWPLWLGAPPCASSIVAAVLVTLAILAAVHFLPGLLGGPTVPGVRLFTPKQLKRYDGRASKKVYLAMLGSVYDVTAGARHYGPEGGYSVFAGRDASRSYVTGKFQEDLHDEVEDFDGEKMAELVRWRDFYEKHKEYFLVGRVVGRFYDGGGQPTPLLQQVEAMAAAHKAGQELAAAAAGGDQQQQQQQQGFPCNVKWSKAEGGSVWCPQGSVPRRVLQPDWQGVMQEQCACLESREVSGAARLYDGCPPDAGRCATSPPEETP